MTGKFLIEDDYYLVADQYSWNIGKKIGIDKRSGNDAFQFQTYHRTPEEALKSYLRIKQHDTAFTASDGTISDLVDILSAENKRLQNVLKTAFSAVCDIDLSEKTISG